MTNIVLYSTTLSLLLISYKKDKEKTKLALKKAWKSFEGILPQFLGVIIIVGVLLAILNPQIIARILGGESGILGVIIASLTGAITLMPPFVSFPMVAMLLENGAGLMQMAAFINSLMMVGVATAPIEIQYFGKKLTLWRNIYGFIFSFIVAYWVGRML